MMIFEDVKKKLNANLEFLLKHFAVKIPDYLIHRLKISIINQTHPVMDDSTTPPTIKWHCSWDCTGGLFPCGDIYANHTFKDIIKQAIKAAIKDANK